MDHPTLPSRPGGGGRVGAASSIAPGLAVLGALVTGIAALLTGFAAMAFPYLTGGAVYFIAAALAFGLLANAAYRK